MKNKKKSVNKGSYIPDENYNEPSPKELLDLLSKKHLRYLDLIPKDSVAEKIAYLILEGHNIQGEAGAIFDNLIESIHKFSTKELHTIVFGGGTGLSSILSGDPSLASWSKSPFTGLKKHFPNLTVGVCVTDDGGSSGKLLRDLPCIAIGDLRRAILSSITPDRLLVRYPFPNIDHLEAAVVAIQQILNYRFDHSPDPIFLKTPTILLTQTTRQSIPSTLLACLDNMGNTFYKNPYLKKIPLEEQCLGNLLLIGSIYSQCRPPHKKHSMTNDLFIPSHEEVVKGVKIFAEKIGAGRETIYPVCTTQGELKFLYQHGVLSAGEIKSSQKHSTFPVQCVWVHYVSPPCIDPQLLKKIEQADLIIFSPGSLYTSIIPLLQLSAITEAVRKNHKALKILGANFWTQRGETDISWRRKGKEYYISDLLEAYHHNIPGGIEGLFDSVIVTDLQSIPGDILRNYTIEGKVPIYLDKERVGKMSIKPIEAAVFSEQKLRNEKIIQHDSEKFAQVVKVLYYLRHNFNHHRPEPLSIPISNFNPNAIFPRKGFLCEYWRGICQRVDQMDIERHQLKEIFLKILWNNREILSDHLLYVKGLQIIRKSKWMRSTKWDNILSYYDPQDSYIKMHEELVKGPEIRLVEDLLIALGESLLGNYIKNKSIHEIREKEGLLGKVFEIELRDAKKRTCFLNASELKKYLQLAQLRPYHKKPNCFRMLINDNEAFTPPGLLFGLLYAWYINNQFGGIIDFEMSLLQWKISELMPKPSMERVRMQKQIEFFRQVVFHQNIP